MLNLTFLSPMHRSTLSNPSLSLPDYSLPSHLTLLPFSLFLVYPLPRLPSSPFLIHPLTLPSLFPLPYFIRLSPSTLSGLEEVHHPPETENWDLDITSVTFRDSGVYECQVSTSPKVSLPILLTVLGKQAAVIRGPGEVYVQRGSTISLECEVAAGTEVVGAVSWFRGQHALNYSSPRGGISMEVEKTPTKTTSKLHITRAVKQDSGNYTCRPKLARPASVIVHVVNGK
ncbi:hypothetical protein Pcinc_021233 [Petrolisthes cinctipes]|uniref:Ig-like domain-containing protein n=1 Tax=Petrolisthes cinctipes TaxID=88211 RepID=A0AAE1FGC5_PETCI|nr:hypothetical protein Pcinc_021233 [Petrolisthes cinctipes]